MASVTDTKVKNFNSTMVNSPVLNGVAGSLIGLLDSCLVTGYDTKSLTSLVVLSGVATATFSGTHSAQVDSVVLIAGVTGVLVDLNGEQKVTVAGGTTTIKFSTALADGTAIGTITMKMAPVGWTEVFSGTNVAVYQSSDPTSTKMFLRVDDTGTMQARVVGYEQMTDVNTGSGLFPTATQSAGGGYWMKSSAASIVATPWAIHADSKLFYFSAAAGIQVQSYYYGVAVRCFGDGIPLKPGGDPYFCLLSYGLSSTIDTSGSIGGGNVSQIAVTRSYLGIGTCNLMMRRPYTGDPSLASGADPTTNSYPSVLDGSLNLSKIFISNGTLSSIRGDVPGCFHAPQSLVFDMIKQFDVIPGSGVFAGKNLQAMSASTSFNASSSSNMGAIFFDRTGPWR